MARPLQSDINMTRHTITIDQLPGPPWLRGIAIWIGWAVPSKNACIAAVVLTALWIAAYCVTQHPPEPIPAGITELIALILGINTVHSIGQAHIEGRTTAQVAEAKAEV